MNTEDQTQPVIPWLDRFTQPSDDEKFEAEQVDFIVTLMELEFK